MKTIAAFLYLVQTAVSLWPIPAQYTHGTDVLWIDPDVKISYQGASGVSASPGIPYQYPLADLDLMLKATGGATNDSASASIIQTAIDGATDTLFNKNFLPWKFHPRNSNYEPAPGGTTISSVVLTSNGTSSATNISKPLDGQIDESYSLKVSSTGEASISAASANGLAYGLNTFTQLFFAHSQGGVYTNLAPVDISDEPKFAHRGLNLDVSRNYYDVSDIQRLIDALAFNKFNRLHVHITDAQSWPLEVPALPELSAQGAYAPNLIYTSDQVQQLQQFGAARGVEVFLEIDMPGHTSAVAFSHPELIAAFNAQPYSTYCGEPPCGTFKLNDTAVYSFLDTLFSDLLPRLSPNNAYFHTGGDEVNFNSYQLDDGVGTNDTTVIKPLLQAFFDHIHSSVTDAGLTQIVWEEMLLSYNLTIPPDVIIQSWQSDQAVQQIVNSGHRAIAGNYDYWYLDCGHGQWINFAPEVANTYYPFQDYCGPLKNWRDMYTYDPLSGVGEDQASQVVGGEASIWSEQADGISLDGIIWPRLGAAGEVLWSGAKDPATGQNRSQIDAAPRLSEMRERLVARGVGAATIQMPFCTQNGTQCYLDTSSG